MLLSFISCASEDSRDREPVLDHFSISGSGSVSLLRIFISAACATRLTHPLYQSGGAGCWSAIAYSSWKALLISQLSYISRVCFTVRHLWMQMAAVTALPHSKQYFIAMSLFGFN